MERPLPDDVARAVRSYLTALVPDADVSDAWHDVVADASYWGERDLVPVLRLAHQVVLQHQPVTSEVAALALVETGVDDPHAVATVLDTDAGTATDWIALVRATRQDEEVAAGSAAAPASPARPDPTADVPDPEAPSAPAAAPTPRPPAPHAAADTSSSEGEAVRIGFEDDAGLPEDLARRVDPRASLWGLATAALALVVVAVVVVWVLTR